MLRNRFCDVLISGGGVAGVTAAVASARSGAHTVLIEKENFLGGVGFMGMLQHICGLYANSSVTPTETLNKGIVSEIVEFLNNISPDKRVVRIGRVFVLPVSRTGLGHVLSALCSDEPNLTVFLDTTAVSVRTKGREIHEVSVYNSGNMHSIFPKAVIDCTGNGSVSVMAGAGFGLSPKDVIQLAGYIIRLKGLRKQDETLAIKVPYCLAEAVQKNIIPHTFRFSHYARGDTSDECYCKFSVDNSENGLKAHEYSIKAHRYLSESLYSFKKSYIVETSMGVISRESRRICGKFKLSEKDILGARKFHDGVVKGAWPIEIWNKNKGTIYKYIKSDDYYEIPFRCLEVKNISNLLCAGRIISVSHEAYASTRVMGTCMALGEQAGQAAAYLAQNGNYPYKRTTLPANSGIS